ncbi:UDP-N-acetylmuramate dehydrogenase [Fodinicola feengrottensis]|uniref:UDP-N-acetylenolpyruvoylglucosamine reductase n=1 Tax=Fodinicola feengrottensis TaxID=435914 RepID=A0ABN2I4A2_9ACTN
MRTASQAPLDGLTTLRLGGPASTLVEVTTAAEAIDAVAAAAEPVLVLAGGSNVVLPDRGLDGTVVLLRSAGRQVSESDDSVTVTVQAGETWDDLVAWSVREGLAGIECLAGIPGSVGATPVQNVGAYGQEVADTITAVRAYDRLAGVQKVLTPAECGFTYRHSVFKGHDRWLVLDVTFQLRRAKESEPLRFGELTRRLAVDPGGSAPLADVRDAVLALRAGKGMVLDAADHDTWSVGSFFTNPVLEPADYDEVVRRCAALHGPDVVPPRFAADGLVKTSAAWLIERAGFARGHGRDGVSLSTKHTLALTNRGTGTTTALLALAREVRDGVRDTFGVTLVNEPVIVGDSL